MVVRGHIAMVNAQQKEKFVKMLKIDSFPFGSNSQNSYVSVKSALNVLLETEEHVANAMFYVNPFIAKFTKWSNTLKQFVRKLPTNCLSVFDHFVGLALKGLIKATQQT